MASFPKAPKEKHFYSYHGEKIEDEYYWIRDLEDPRVMEYIRQENNYSAVILKPLENLQEELFVEIKSRTKENDQTVPEKIDNFYYYERTEKDKEYEIYCRKKDDLSNLEEIYLNLNERSEDYIDLGDLDISSDHNKLAYTLDFKGDETFTIFLKDLRTSSEKIFSKEKLGGNVLWTNDGAGLFYDVLNDLNVPYRIEFSSDIVNITESINIFEEPDTTRIVYFYRSKDKKYVFISSESKDSSEIYFINLEKTISNESVTLICKRRENVIYHVEHNTDYFYILTNDNNCENFQILRVREENFNKKDAWEIFLPHSDNKQLESIEMFQKFLVVHIRLDGIQNLMYYDFEKSSWNIIDNLPETQHTLNYHDQPGNYDFFSPVVRFTYSSLITPSTVIDFNMNTKTYTILKIDEIVKYAKTDYITKRVFANAKDGTKVPISIVHKKGIVLDGSNPCLVYGYGCYGMSSEPGFLPSIISLLDRGFIYAISHVRGGGEYGRNWYLAGKYENKSNSFTDFVSCLNYLIEKKYSNESKIAVRGGSAGGLLVGAVLNMTQHIHTAVMDVPFLDALNTMMDPSIPLTTLEYYEYGDPSQNKKYYNSIKSFSPYDNLIPKKYPNILILTNIHDTRVPYWEPIKYVAKLRTIQAASENLLALKTNLQAGHGGVSGKYRYLKELSLEYAFIIFTILNKN